MNDFEQCISEWADQCRERDQEINKLKAEVLTARNLADMAASLLETRDTTIAQLQATLAAREARIAELVEGLRTIAYADWSPELNKEISAAMERGELKHMTGVEWLAQRLLTQLEAHRKEG